MIVDFVHLMLIINLSKRIFTIKMIYNIKLKQTMKYCLSQAFSPISFVKFHQQNSSQKLFVGLIWSTQIIFILLGLYIVFKMCQLCSKAFSYSNFHIHEAYKFYTLALISTIMIMISRAVQLEFAEKITYAKLNPDDAVPFRKDPYYEGWVIFNEIMGLISIYTVNLMYALSSMTWLMVANKCDFNSRDSAQGMDEQEAEIRLRDHKFYIKLRLVLLYGLIPGSMLISICGVLNFTQGWCITSKTLLMITNLSIFILTLYALMNLFLQRYKDKITPLKIKIMWGYLMFSISGRQVMALFLQIQDFIYPFQREYVPIQGQNQYNILVFLYSLTVTTIPIFVLSYLADKQLETQKIQCNCRLTKCKDLKGLYILAQQYDNVQKYLDLFKQQLQMQKHPQLTFIVRNPNGSLQLATQPAVKDVRLIKCQECQRVHTMKDMTKIKCSQCGTTISSSRCDQPGCKGNIQFVYYGSLIVRECSSCKKVIPIS